MNHIIVPLLHSPQTTNSHLTGYPKRADLIDSFSHLNKEVDGSLKAYLLDVSTAVRTGDTYHLNTS